MSGDLQTAAQTVVSLPPRGEWFGDARDGSRALRASWHADAGCLVLSMWRDDQCVATTRLAPAETARLLASLACALVAGVPAPASGSESAAG